MDQAMIDSVNARRRSLLFMRHIDDEAVFKLMYLTLRNISQRWTADSELECGASIRLPGIEASRGCPFSCNFCVLTGHEKYRYRPVEHVIDEIKFKMHWNKNYFGLFDNAFSFLDNNLGGDPRYLRTLCEALLPLKKTWGCALTFNVLKDEELVKLMAQAGCRYIYTGLESLNPDSIKAMNKGQNKITEVDRVIRRCFANGIMLSFGLLVGSDGDTNEYLEKRFGKP